MDINGLILEEEFLKSEAYDEWHNSLSDILNFLREALNPELKLETDKTDKERAMEYKINLIFNSIRLGLYYNKLIEGKEEITK